ncbi:MAG: HAMP domain-containing sensor histidine kinase [Bacteroidales bacterium]|nr:HAMP domain-containing sensor histidine kinase [Bacteroidales bacterium]
MKKERFQLLLLILSLMSLMALVGIQVAWTVRAARMQENQFNHSVRMAINSATDNISENKFLCEGINNCLFREGHGSCAMIMENMAEWDSLESVIRKDLEYYGIDLDFEFDIAKAGDSSKNTGQNEVYLSRNLEHMLERSGYYLSIRFPGRRDFIIAQMGNVFIVSIILLLIVTLSSILIYRYYRRERQLSSNTIDLVNNMTHAFKTPLTNIALAASMIKKSKEVRSNKSLSSYAGIIQAEHRKLKQRVDKLLDTSFYETDPSSLYEPVNIIAVAREVMKSFEVQAEEMNGQIKLETKEKELFILGNQDLLYIALSNIIDNSLKYNTNSPDININISKSENKIIIVIKDNGPGVPEEVLDKIFNRYYRLDSEQNNSEGLGLGLYQVKNIAERMKGKVQASSADEGGLIIIIELPCIDHE